MSSLYVKDMAGGMLRLEFSNDTLVTDVKQEIFKWKDEYEIYRQRLTIMTDVGYTILEDSQTCVSYGIKADDMIYLYVSDPLWQQFMDDYMSGYYTVNTLENKYFQEKCAILWEQMYKECVKHPDDPISQCIIGACHFYPLGGLEKNDELAVICFLDSTKRGNLQAIFMLSYCYEMGCGVEKNDSKSLELLKSAAEGGHVQAQNLLAICYGKGKLGLPKDEKQAIVWYEKAAEQNYPTAQYNLGIKFFKGCGVEKDDSKAIQWYLRAAENGSADAQFNLGVCYERGEGVSPDFQTAVKWYKMSALKGNMNAQYNLGFFYLSGRGLTKDILVGLDWLRKAADNGSYEARSALEQLS
jgi:TPR repeat protein